MVVKTLLAGENQNSWDFWKFTPPKYGIIRYNMIQLVCLDASPYYISCVCSPFLRSCPRLLSSNSSARRERRLRGLGGAAGLGLLGLTHVNPGKPRIQRFSMVGHHVPLRFSIFWGNYCTSSSRQTHTNEQVMRMTSAIIKLVLRIPA